MGVYLLHCNEQQANEQWENWLQSRAISIWLQFTLPINLATPDMDITPIESENDPRVLFSILCNPGLGLRIFSLATILFGLVLGELFTLALPSLLVWLAAIPIVGIVLVVVILLLWVILAASSSFTPGLCHGLFTFEESIFFRNVEEAGIGCYPMTAPSQWVLFPRDAVLILYVALLIFAAQLLASLNLWGIVSLLAPILLLGLPFVFVDLTREYANRELQNTSSPLAYWKIALVETNRNMGIFFYIPLIFYCFMHALMWIQIAISYMTLPDTGNISLSVFVNAMFKVDVAKILKGASRQSLDHIVNYSLHHLAGRANDSVSVIFTLVMIGLTLAICIIFVQLLRNQDFFKTDLWLNRKLNPTLVPLSIDQNSTYKSTNVLIAATCIWLFWLIATCATILALATLWSLGEHIGWIPIDWLTSFVWYQALVWLWVGSFGSHILLVAVFSPALLWFLMWLYSLMDSGWRLVISLPGFRGNQHRAKIILRELCREQRVGPPFLRIDDTTAGWPITIPIFPVSRFCVIHLSDRLTKDLNDEQLKLVLAHELAHAILHARKLWLMQLLSSMSFLGTGYLTLLLDYWEMELQADAYAVHLTRNRDALINLLQILPQIEADASIQLLTGNSSTVKLVPHSLTGFVVLSVRLMRKRLTLLQPLLYKGVSMVSLGRLQWNMKRDSALVGEVVEAHKRLSGLRRVGGELAIGVAGLYKFYFGDTVWGALHPPLEVRSSYLLPDPNDIFTQETEEVLDFAKSLALDLKHGPIEIEHLLCSLLFYEYEAMSRVLSPFGTDLKAIRMGMEFLMEYKKTDPDWPSKKGLYDSHAERAIALAIEEANLMQHHPARPEHLLLGIACEAGDNANSKLGGNGITPEKLRAQVFQVLTSRGVPSTNVSKEVTQETQDNKESNQRSKDLSIQKSGQSERFDKFTDGAKKVFILAEEEAQRLQHNWIGTEHILLGLILEKEGFAAQILKALGVNVKKTRSAIMGIRGLGSRNNNGYGKLELTENAKRVIELAVDEAHQLNYPFVDTEHLLLGLLSVNEIVGTIVLKHLKEAIREAILEMEREARSQSDKESDYSNDEEE